MANNDMITCPICGKVKGRQHVRGCRRKAERRASWDRTRKIDEALETFEQGERERDELARVMRHGPEHVPPL